MNIGSTKNLMYTAAGAQMTDPVLRHKARLCWKIGGVFAAM